MTVMELQKFSKYELDKCIDYLLSDNGHMLPMDEITFGRSVQLIGELNEIVESDEFDDAYPPTFHSKWMLLMMINAKGYNTWFKAFAGISIKSLREFIESRSHCNDRPFGKLLNDEPADNVTVDDIMKTIHKHIFDSWTPSFEIESYTQKIIGYCENVLDLINGLEMANICPESEKRSQKTFDDRDKLLDYIFGADFKIGI